MEKFPQSNGTESEAQKWFTGAQEELAKERQKTQSDYDREEGKQGKPLIDVEELKKKVEAEREKNSEENTREWFSGVQEKLAKERQKTQSDYDNE